MIDLSPTKYVSLSLHDALPIFLQPLPRNPHEKTVPARRVADEPPQLSGQVRSARAAGFSCVREPDAGARRSVESHHPAFRERAGRLHAVEAAVRTGGVFATAPRDRKSTRLNSSHVK